MDASNANIFVVVNLDVVATGNVALDVDNELVAPEVYFRLEVRSDAVLLARLVSTVVVPKSYVVGTVVGAIALGRVGELLLYVKWI